MLDSKQKPLSAQSKNNAKGLSSATVRRWYAVHKWSSLICSLVMLIACVTGLPLVFHDEIHQLESYLMAEPTTPMLETNQQSPKTFDQLLNIMNLAHPDLFVQLLLREPSDPGVTTIGMGVAPDAPLAESQFFRIDNLTGELLGVEQIGDGLMGFLTLLHVELFAGLPGTLFLGAMAIVFMLAIVSGLVIYAPFMRRRSFAVVCLDKGERRRQSDLHNWLAMVVVVWLSVVTLTGIINTWGSPLIQFWLLNDLQDLIAEDNRPVAQQASLSSFTQAYQQAKENIPDASFSFAFFPATEFSSDRHYLIFFNGNTPLSSRLLTPGVVNAYSGEFIAAPRLPWYIQTLLLSQPLHFGDYGGLALKLAWAILDLAAIVVLYTGLVLWWQKRRQPPNLEPMFLVDKL